MSTRQAAPSLRPDELPAVTVPPSLNTGLSAASCSRLVRRGYSSVSNTCGGPFAGGHLHRDDLVPEPPALDGREGALLAPQGVLVLLLARDVVLLREVLRRQAHGQVAVHLVRLRARLALGVGVDDDGVAGDEAEAGAAEVVRREAHALHASGDHDVGLAAPDGLHGVVHRLQAGAALAHDRVGRHLDGEAGLERRHSRQVGRVGALLGLAEDDLVHLGRRHAGALDGRLDDDPPEFLGLDVLERAADAAERRAHGRDDDDVGSAGTAGKRCHSDAPIDDSASSTAHA